MIVHKTFETDGVVEDVPIVMKEQINIVMEKISLKFYI